MAKNFTTVCRAILYFLFALLPFGLFAQFGGGTGSQADPYQISTPAHLQYLSTLVMSDYTDYSTNGKYFKLTSNINMFGQTFTPIGGWSNSTTLSFTNFFNGWFDGCGFKITNLTINKSTVTYNHAYNFVGLFGSIGAAATISNLSVSGNFTGHSYVGSLAGFNRGVITNCYTTTSTVSSTSNTFLLGGLVGTNYTGIIANCYTIASTISGEGRGTVGGLVGDNCSNWVGGIINNCYSNCAVSSTNTYSWIGGLLGCCSSGTITNSYAAPTSISTQGQRGAFVGGCDYYMSNFSNCYYSSALGFAGFGDGFATGCTAKTDAQLKAASMVSIPGSVNNSLNFGQTAPYPWKQDVAPLVNQGFPILKSMFYITFNANNGTGSMANQIFAVGEAQNLNYNTFSNTGYSFAGWATSASGSVVYSNQQSISISANTTLYAKWNLKTTITINETPQSFEYNGSAGAFSVTSTSPTGLSGFSVSYSSTNPTNAGSYNVTITRPEDATYAAFSKTINGGLVITTKPLTVSGYSITKIYDGINTVTSFGSPIFNGLVSGQGATVTTAASTYNNADVGTGTTITLGAVTATSGTGGFIATNYTITQLTGIIGAITAKPLTVSGYTITKIYDGINTVTSFGSPTFSGLVSGQGTTVTTAASTYNNADVGTSTTIALGAVTATGGTGGFEATNYSITQPTGITGAITEKQLTVSGFSITKVYDGNTNVTTWGTPTFTGLVGVQTANVSTSGVVGTFNNANVGAGKSVSFTGTFAMAGGTAVASNYTVMQPTGLTGIITVLQIAKPTVTSGALTYNGSPQTPTIATNPAYTIMGNTGTNASTSYISTISLNNTPFANYQWTDGTTAVHSLPWSIEKAAVTVTANAQSKVYLAELPTLDYTTNPVNLIAGNPITGDLETTATQTSNVGTYPITQGTLTIASGNYLITYISADLTINNLEVAQPSVLGTLTYNGTLQNPNIATNAAYVITNNSATNAGNYNATITLNTNYAWIGGSTTAFTLPWSIIAKELTISNFNIIKTYDGNTTVTNWGTPTFDGLVLGQTSNVNPSDVVGTYASAAVNTNIPISFTGTFDLIGGTAIATNYTVIQPSGLNPIRSLAPFF